MKLTKITTIALALTLFLSGCTKTVYGVSSGTYALEDTDAAITIDVDEHTFSFTYDPLSSYFNYGSWCFEDGNLVATTDDGKYTFVFDVPDNDSLVFIEDKSSEIITTLGEKPVSDGASFVYED